MTYDPNDWNPMLPALDVPEHKPVDTGLLNKRGQPIMRQPPRVGFHTPKVTRG
jgi:hypothetical protein